MTVHCSSTASGGRNVKALHFIANALHFIANTHSSAPLDASSSLSALEESQFSSSDGEGDEATSSSDIEGSSSQNKPLKTTAIVHVSGSSQVSSPTRQKDQTVVLMDTDEADKQQELGASLVQARARDVERTLVLKAPDLQT